MIRKPALSRRAFLRGAGGVVVGLPFLDAMLPGIASAQTSAPKRFVVAFNGSTVGPTVNSVPSATGALPTTMPLSWKALEPIRQHVTLVSGLEIPVYNPSLGQAYIPGGSHGGQHGFTRGPILCGMGSRDSMQIAQACKTSMHAGNQTCDQYAADYLAGATRFRSLALKVQAVPYNGNPTSNNGSMSARRQNGVVSAVLPQVSPLDIYNALFTGVTPAPTMPTNPTNPTPAPSQALLRKKSVLDLVLEDRQRLEAKLGGEDRARLSLHFDEIRGMEQRLSSQLQPADAGTTMMPPPAMGCTAPPKPMADPAINSLNFGGWSNETWRGEVQADLIAHAIACDLTRVVSWMITHDQCWLNSTQTTGINSSYTNPTPTGLNDIHADSHNAPGTKCAANNNWHATLWGRLVNNLATRSDANGTLLSNTLLALVSAEGGNAHSRSNFTIALAGLPSKIYNGVHVASGGLHPARVMISSLEALGVPMNGTLGEVSGVIPGLLK